MQSIYLTYVCRAECAARGSCLLSQFLILMLTYVRFRIYALTINPDFRVSNKSDHICKAHFRDNSITIRLFGVCALVVPGCKLHFSDEQFAAGG